MDRMVILTEAQRYRLLSLIEAERQECGDLAWRRGLLDDRDGRDLALSEAHDLEDIAAVIRSGVPDDVVEELHAAVDDRAADVRGQLEWAVKQESRSDGVQVVPAVVSDMARRCESAGRVLARLRDA